MVICLSGEKLSIKNSFKIFTSIETRWVRQPITHHLISYPSENHGHFFQMNILIKSMDFNSFSSCSTLIFTHNFLVRSFES